MQQRLEHTFEATPARFWSLYMRDRVFLEAVYAHMHLQIEALDITETGEGDAMQIRRIIHLLPQRDMPGFLKALMKGTATVKQTEHFDATRQQMELSIDLPVIGDRVRYGGQYRTQPLDAPNSPTLSPRCLRTFNGHCNARIPLIGSRIEAYFLDEMTRGVEEMVPFIHQWLARPEG